jgi:hypothetical protein
MAGAVSDWGGRDSRAVADPQKGTITMIPEYGDEELIGQRSERLREQSEDILPQDREDAPEREMEERDREDQELEYSIRKTTRRMPSARCVPGAEHASPRARMCGCKQTAAGYTRYVRRPGELPEAPSKQPSTRAGNPETSSPGLAASYPRMAR